MELWKRYIGKGGEILEIWELCIQIGSFGDLHGMVCMGFVCICLLKLVEDLISADD
jgi:hypothetical protein